MSTPTVAPKTASVTPSTSVVTSASLAKPEPPNTIPAPPPDTAPTGPPPPELTRQQKIVAKLTELYVKIDQLDGQVYSHRGSCTKCGWQSYQHSEAEARQIVITHVMNHWRDVAAGI